MSVTGEYEKIYQELQQRMGPGGDLAVAGEFDTKNRHKDMGMWTPARTLLHEAVVERFKAQCQGKPRDGRAVLFTGGAPGSGKGRARRNLSQWEAQDSALGEELRRVHGVDLDDYVVLDPDEFKVMLFEQGATAEVPAGADRLSDGRPLSPSEKASLVHRESGEIQDAVERWARSKGYNLLYDQSLRALGWTSNLLADLEREGYDKRVLLSVEVPETQCLEQNAARWLDGRREFDAGRDWYGGRMAPEGFIRSLYADSGTGRGYSIGRENAEKLAEQGLATGLITTDRGDFGPKPVPEAAPAAAARTFQRGDATVRVGRGAEFMPGVDIPTTRAPSPRGVSTPPPPAPSGPARGPGFGL
ncbi:zeta toxin family protein [Streptomyces sp. NBC_01565]|uniref:zeta toxin family protein n=1 Tax=unclassified Streptomyces TaxID=2593676 RepID=UPI00225C0F26|nr:zeta toxin family protein [Streptomyces sp. NBC_01565]MCX4539356.1 zeta toxin family protein [Streptomyces sp. NBC_01565]